MKYAIVTRAEWEQNEAYPPNSFCIVFLTNTGDVAPDELIENLSGVIMGAGNVWTYDDSMTTWIGTCPLPTDIEFVGVFDTEPEAITYYIAHYVNDTVELERDVNKHIDLNDSIDDLWEDRATQRRKDRYYWAIMAALVLIVIVLLLARLFVLLGYR